MSKIAILRLLNGTLSEGYSYVELRIIDRETGNESSVSAKLPSSPELEELLKQFSQTQKDWGESNRLWRNRPTGYPRGFDLPDDPLTNKSLDIVEQIQKTLDNWLDEKVFAPIKNEFLGDAREIKRLLIETSDLSLQKMPWKRWKIIERYCPNVEIAFCSDAYLPQERLRNPVRILAILGRDTDIDLEIEQGFLENIPGARTTIIPKDSKQKLTLDEFYQALENETFDILFFAGHSLTNTEGTDTRLWINSDDYVTIDNLSSCLREAVARGLKLAIFNSCSGLGIPRRLSSLKVAIPYLIVMIEPIHDKLAQKFLEIFLVNHFITGKSLQKSFQIALNNLRIWQQQSPNADFLPVLFHNPRNPSIFYPKLNFIDYIKLFPKAKNKKEYFLRIFRKFPLLKFVLLSVLALLFVLYFKYQSMNLSPNRQLMANFCPENSHLITCGDTGNSINYPRDASALPEEKDGQFFFSKRDYQKAYVSFQKAWQKEKDPVTLIALNNVKVFNNIKQEKISENKIYTLGVVIPYDIDSDVIGKDMLANIARKQNEINENSKSSWRLVVVMANDSNEPVKGEKIASDFGKRKNVLAVVGPYSSHMAAYIIDDYRKNNLSLISPSVTTSLQYLKNVNVTDTSFFFRTASSTQVAAQEMIRYLEEYGYQKIILFYQDRELFGKSYYLDFINSIASSNLKIIYRKQLVDLIPTQIKAELEKLTEQYGKERDKTAIVLLDDAYTEDRGQINKLEIIKLNKGNFFIIGSNTVHDPQVLKLGRKAIEKVIVTVPYFPLPQQNEDFQRIFGKDENLSWHGAMTYDVMEILIQAISELVNLGEKPTREGIQRVLSGIEGAIAIDGLTGTVTLQGSDRKESINSLITPNCSINSCQGWKEVPQ